MGSLGPASFDEYIGIDYSGAGAPTRGLAGLRVYVATGTSDPVEVAPPQGRSKYWSRRGIAEWLEERLNGPNRALVGLDHGFSFPRAYFERHGLAWDWPAFLDDFHEHWPTDEVSVRSVRKDGRGALRNGKTRWRRASELRTRSAKSVFHFDVPGAVATSTHAGLPWLRHLRRAAGDRVHFWPFDGWEVPDGRSAIIEVYPSLWSRGFPRAGRTPDQHDAYSVAAWLQRTDLDGSLGEYLDPALSPEERKAAEVEGWILGSERSPDLGGTIRGSRKHVLDWAEHPRFLPDLLQLLDPVDVKVTARSAWAPMGYADPVEARLETWGPRHLPSHAAWAELRRWWLAHEKGANTPNWDLALLAEIEGKPGLVLVEAKANVPELSTAGKAPPRDSDRSRQNHERIKRAIAEAREALEPLSPGIRIDRDSHYQLSNRIAFTWKLATLGIPTVLVYLGFAGDQGIADAGLPFRDDQHWKGTFKNHLRDLSAEPLCETRNTAGDVPFWLLARLRPVIEPSPARTGRKRTRAAGAESTGASEGQARG